MDFSFSTWWDSLDVLQQIYWLVAIPSTLLFIIQLIMTFIGADSDHDMDLDHDAEIDADHGMGFHFITFKNLVAFFTIFAWSGLACIEGKLGTTLTLFISVISGLVMMLIMASLYYLMGKLQDSGTLVMTNAIGKIGDVYLTIPPRKEGLGKVQVKVQGGLRTLDAMTAELDPIKTGSLIEVVDVVSEHILVVKRAR